MLISKAPRRGRFSFSAFWIILGASCFVLAWLVPNHYLPWLSFHNEVPMFAAVLALACALCCEGRWLWVPRMVWLFPVVVAGVVAAQLFFGTVLYSGNAVLAGLYLAGILMAWWIGAGNVRIARHPEIWLAGVAALLVFAAMLSAALETLQWLRMETAFNMYAVERGPDDRPSGNLAQPNLLATLLVMATVATALLWRLQYLRNWHAVVLLIYFSFALVMTGSRAGLLGAVCAGVIGLWRARALEWASGWRAITLWWALLALFWWMWVPLNEALLLQAPRELQMRVDGVRLTLWAQTLSAIAQRPWWGYGWNQTAMAQKFGTAAAPGAWSTDYAHNFLLDVVAWFGIPLGLALICCIAWWLVRSFSRLNSSLELLLFCMLVPFLVHSMLEFPFAYAFFLFPVACIFGALHALQSPAAWPVHDGIRRGRRLVVVGLIAAYAVVAGRVFLEYLAAEEDMRIMRFELRRVGQRPEEYASPRIFVLNQLDEVLKLGRLEPARGMAAEDLARMARANSFFNWATLHLNYVIALGLNGQAMEASRQLRILRDLYGPQSYIQAITEFNARRENGHPELAAVEVP